MSTLRDTDRFLKIVDRQIHMDDQILKRELNRPGKTLGMFSDITSHIEFHKKLRDALNEKRIELERKENKEFDQND